MAFQVVFLRRAKRAAQATVDWLNARSPQGAERWLEALGAATNRLKEDALSFAFADEEELAEMEIRQIQFKTRAGRPFRMLFGIFEGEVRILHIRRPGQAPLGLGDLEEQ